ncbi:hypothetical protein D3C73_1061080 [compost metagenome]
MDQVQVQIIKAQLLQAGFVGGNCLFVAEISRPYLGGDEQIFPGQPALGQCLGQCLSYAPLILIDSSRIDAAVAMGNGGLYRLYQLSTVGYLEYAQAKPGHLHAVRQRGCILKILCSLLCH